MADCRPCTSASSTRRPSWEETRQRSAELEERSRTWVLTTFSPMITCSGPFMLVELVRCRDRTASTTPSTTRSSCLPTWPASHERIGFATGILVLPQRQTALVARQAADVDLLSGGRLRLGVGVGWNYVEYEALGQDFGTRGARQEEQVKLLGRLFTEPVVDFSGRFDRVDRAALVPKPARPIPIWLGGSSEAAFDRAARLADGFIFFDGGIAHVVEAWDRMRDRVDGLERSVEDFGGEYVVRPRRHRRTHSGGRRLARGGRNPRFDCHDGARPTTADAHIDYLASVAEALGLP